MAGCSEEHKAPGRGLEEELVQMAEMTNPAFYKEDPPCSSLFLLIILIFLVRIVPHMDVPDATRSTDPTT